MSLSRSLVSRQQQRRLNTVCSSSQIHFVEIISSMLHYFLIDRSAVGQTELSQHNHPTLHVGIGLVIIRRIVMTAGDRAVACLASEFRISEDYDKSK